MSDARVLTADGFVPGTAVAAREHGSVGAPTVVLLHSLGLDGHSFDGVAEQLTADFHLVALDLPGHGRSRPASADLSSAVAQLAPAVRRLAAGGPVHLVGHSFGGAIASELAVVGRGDVASLVVVASPPAGLDVFAQRAAYVDVEATLQRWFRPETLVADGAGVGYARETLINLDPETWRQAWSSFAQWEGSEVLRQTDAPLLAIAGAQDVSTPVSALREVLRSAGRGTATPVVIDPAAHMLLLENPPEVAAVLGAFWSSLAPASSSVQKNTSTN